MAPGITFPEESETVPVSVEAEAEAPKIPALAAIRKAKIRDRMKRTRIAYLPGWPIFYPSLRISTPKTNRGFAAVYSTPEFCEQAITLNEISNMHAQPQANAIPQGSGRGAAFVCEIKNRVDRERDRGRSAVRSRSRAQFAQESVFKEICREKRLLRQRRQYILN